MSVSLKFFVSMMLLSVVLLAATLGVSRWQFLTGFDAYVEQLEQGRLQRMANDLSEHYSLNETWGDDTPTVYFRLLWEVRPRGQRGRPRPHLQKERGAPHPTALFSKTGEFIAGDDLPSGRSVVVPVLWNGDEVGQLRSVPSGPPSRQAAQFSDRQAIVSWIVGLLAVFLAALTSLAFARAFARPITAGADAVQKLTDGDFSVHLASGSNDELGHLSRSINVLATILAKNRESQRRWIADVSHELRTPLAVLTAEIEALQDGVRKVTPDALDSLAQEAARIGRLVDDLYQLSVSDMGGLRYEFESVDLDECLDATVAALAPKDVDVEFISPGPTLVRGDSRRLEQLFRNLILNSMAYTDRPGQLRITVSHADGIDIDIEDSAPGVPEDMHQYLFDPLFRIEADRSRRTGGAGLGLAICRNIVDAHGGSITARPSDLGGLRVSIHLLKADL